MRVLLAWELGDNFGHVGTLLHIAEALQNRGCDVTLALQNLAGAGSLLAHTNIRIMAAPYARVKPKVRPAESGHVITYADDIRNCGYEDEEELAALIRGWDGLYDSVKPDILVVNSAPTALLASKGRVFKTISVGSGYELPPQSSPMPFMRFWERPDMEDLAKREWRVLSVVNAAQRLLKRPMFKNLADILKSDAEFLMTFPELDHYMHLRKKGFYVGPFFVSDKGRSTFWPEGRKNKRIFAYLYPGRPVFAPVLQALKVLPHDVILVAPKISSKQIKQLETERFRIFDTPIRLDALASECDLCITHGGSSTFAQFLLKAVPQLVLPNHIEQMMTAKRIEAAGVGLTAHAGMPFEQIENRIAALLNDQRFKDHAKEFASKIKKFDPLRQADMLAGKILDSIKTDQKI